MRPAYRKHADRLTVALALAALAAVALHSFGAEQASAEPGSVHPMNVIRDSGAFTYYVNEERVGTSQFTWSQDGSFENEAAVTIAGQTLPMSTSIQVDADGRWTKIAMNTARGPATIDRAGSSVTINVAGQSSTLELKPGSLLMEDMSPALMSQAVAAYDHGRAGRQEFPVYFLPIMPIQGSLKLVETFQRFVDYKPQTFRKYLYELPPIYDVHVIVDEQNRVCLAEYPAQHGLFIREGCEMLAAAAAPSLLSQPEYDVVEERGMGVPMRDGVELATDIYRPKKDGPSPVILVRTPYKKEMAEWQARFYARRGYAFAVQDVRGRFSSPGQWDPYVHEADDGYDAVEWLAEQPWSNGKVGMMGGSYSAWAAWWAASRRPPHLATIISSVSPPEPYFNSPYEYGAFMLSPTLWWSEVLETEATADISGLAIEESLDVFGSEKLKHLPVIELDEIILGRRDPYWRECIAHPDYDDHWQALAFMESMKDVNIPVYHQSGWFDGDGIGAKLNYLGMVGHGHPNQKLVIGPWGHSAADHRFGARGVDWGPRAIVDLQTSYLRWIDRWLQGIENGIDVEPSVSLFVMGANDWLHSSSYPPMGADPTKLYLASSGDAATWEDKGRLTTEPQDDGASTPDRYVYDPADPTPRSLERREDVLVYRTSPLAEPLTIAGPISAVLYASSSARDTDWAVTLVREDQQGRPLRLAQGIIRARYRDSFSRPQLLEPDKVYQYRLDLWHTGVTVNKGERLTLIISSALFPKFSRNLNTGGHNETETRYVSATQTVYHDAEHPSHLLLPVVPDPAFGDSRAPM